MGWLIGYWNRKELAVAGNALYSGYTNILVTLHYGAGTDSTSDIYLQGQCAFKDFRDVRFTAGEVTSVNAYLMSKTDGDTAVVAVQCLQNLSYDQTLMVYYGNTGASANWKFDQSLHLAGWKEKKAVPLTAGVGVAASDMQIPITVHYGVGVDSAGVVYCNSLCNTDFSDIRFIDTSGNLLDYVVVSKTDGSVANVWVEYNGNLNNNQTMYICFGNASATDASSEADTFVDVISGVVGAWNMEEADQEVSPIVIADDNQTTLWSDAGYHCTLSNDSTVKIAGVDCLKISITSNASYFAKNLAAPLDLSAKSLIRFYWYGLNSGVSVNVVFCTDTGMTKTFTYSFIDHFSGWKLFIIPYSTFTILGTPNWNNINRISISFGYTTGNVVYFDRLIADVGVPATDYSGNGNTGTATGTTVVAGKFAGKNARSFNGLGDLVSIINNLDFANQTFTVFAYIKTTSANGAIVGKGEGTSCWYTYHGIVTAHKLGLLFKNASGVTVYDGEATTTAVDNGSFHLCSFVVTTSTTVAANNNTAIYVDKTSQTMNQTKTDIYTASQAATIKIGVRNTSNFFNGVISGVFIVSGDASSYVNNISDNYPDVSLDTGKVCVRKYASTTQPTVGTAYPNFISGVTNLLTVSPQITLYPASGGAPTKQRVKRADPIMVTIEYLQMKQKRRINLKNEHQ